MGLVKTELHGDVIVIRMQRGVTNAIDLELVEALYGTLVEARDEASALVIAGGAKFFSIGLDLPQMLGKGRDELRHFWDRYNGFCHELYTLPIPTVSAIKGHAIAGGTIISLMTDRRVISTGRKLTGLNEVRIGLPVPLLPHLVLREVAGERAATEIVSRGELHAPDDALCLGLVDEVCPPDGVEPRAVGWAQELGGLPRAAFAAIKRTRTAAVSAAYKRSVEAKTEEFLDCWYSAETLELLERAAEAF